jgi:hypothetical protein
MNGEWSCLSLTVPAFSGATKESHDNNQHSSVQTKSRVPGLPNMKNSGPSEWDVPYWEALYFIQIARRKGFLCLQVWHDVPWWDSGFRSGGTVFETRTRPPVLSLAVLGRLIRDPGWSSGQVIRDLWWTKRHWEMFSLSTSVSPAKHSTDCSTSPSSEVVYRTINRLGNGKLASTPSKNCVLSSSSWGRVGNARDILLDRAWRLHTATSL